ASTTWTSTPGTGRCSASPPSWPGSWRRSPMPDRAAPGAPAPSAESALTTRPLDASTWDAFADLVERNNGIFGGCWCIGFHSVYQRGVSDPRTLKEQLVRAGEAHAAMVF